jgi:hypothetical protein
MSGREAIIGVWFVVAILVEVGSTLALLLWLHRRGVRLVFGMTGIPGYLERAYREWCRNQGRSSTVVLVLRTFSLINVIVAAIVAIPVLAGR